MHAILLHPGVAHAAGMLAAARIEAQLRCAQAARMLPAVFKRAMLLRLVTVHTVHFACSSRFTGAFYVIYDSNMMCKIFFKS